MRWITRERPKIDRIACPWLITRFIDPQAEFLYVGARNAKVNHITGLRRCEEARLRRSPDRHRRRCALSSRRNIGFLSSSDAFRDLVCRPCSWSNSVHE
ncbi:chromate resistance protein [Pseudomonas sp. B21-015]|nr:chromate resistance protein [Pseudomonas sp. B21-015]